jgi:hypothetical protein
MPTTILPSPVSLERSRLLPADFAFRRVLARMYERRAIIDDLIHCLEQYEQNKAGTAQCVPFSAPKRCL